MFYNQKLFRLFLLLIFMGSSIQAQEIWDWNYSEAKEKKLKKEEKLKEEEDYQKYSLISERLEVFQQQYKEALAEAISNPTVKNFLYFKKVQQKINYRTIDKWHTIYLFDFTSKNSTVIFPGLEKEVQAFSNLETKFKEEKIKKIPINSSLLFIYNSGDDPVCQKMGNIVLELSKKYQWLIWSHSRDFVDLPEFKSTQTTCYLLMYLKNYLENNIIPAIYFLDFTNEKLFTISLGLQSLEMVENNILMHLKKNNIPLHVDKLDIGLHQLAHNNFNQKEQNEK